MTNKRPIQGERPQYRVGRDMPRRTDGIIEAYADFGPLNDGKVTRETAGCPDQGSRGAVRGPEALDGNAARDSWGRVAEGTDRARGCRDREKPSAGHSTR